MKRKILVTLSTVNQKNPFQHGTYGRCKLSTLTHKKGPYRSKAQMQVNNLELDSLYSKSWSFFSIIRPFLCIANTASTKLIHLAGVWSLLLQYVLRHFSAFDGAESQSFYSTLFSVGCISGAGNMVRCSYSTNDGLTLTPSSVWQSYLLPLMEIRDQNGSFRSFKPTWECIDIIKHYYLPLKGQKIIGLPELLSETYCVHLNNCYRKTGKFLKSYNWFFREKSFYRMFLLSILREKFS